MTMARGDFDYILVLHTFNANNPTWATNFPVNVDAGLNIVDDGYLLITVRSVDSQAHRIQINGQDLSGFDIPLPPGNSHAWLTYMDRIQPGLLRPGLNNIQNTRVGNDNFVVRDVVVH